MPDIDKLIRENVKVLVPYSCARDEFQGKDGTFMDANENPYGTLNRYPDPYQKELKKAISRIKNIPAENIFLGNGSDEIIDLCYRIFCRPGIDKALTLSPSYGMYEVSANVNDIKLIKSELSADFQIEIDNVIPLLKDPFLKLIFICSPNNPTGNSFKSSSIEFIISSFNGIVVIDEAYIDFAKQSSYIKSVFDFNNLIVMQTFSKSMGLAAARVGIAYMNSSLLHFFNKMKPPYNISTINQNACLEGIKHYGSLKTRVKRIINERERLATLLKKMSTIEEVYPSDSNFLLIRTRNPDLIYSKLIANKIIVRNRNKIIPGCIRITVGTKRENEKLIKALQRIKI